MYSTTVRKIIQRIKSASSASHDCSWILISRVQLGIYSIRYNQIKQDHSPIGLNIMGTPKQLHLPGSWGQPLYDTIHLIWFVAGCSHLQNQYVIV